MNPKNVTPFSHYILTMNKNVPCKFVSRLFVKRILLVIFSLGVEDIEAEDRYIKGDIGFQGGGKKIENLTLERSKGGEEIGK